MTTAEANHIVFHYYYHVLHFCGCYTPDAVLDELETGLEHFDQDREHFTDEQWKEHVQWTETHLLLTYLLDALGLTDHGGNVGNASLTPLGDKLLEALRASDEDWDEDSHHWTAWQIPEAVAHEAAFRKECGRADDSA